MSSQLPSRVIECLMDEIGIHDSLVDAQKPSADSAIELIEHIEKHFVELLTLERKKAELFAEWTQIKGWTYYESDMIWILNADYMNGLETTELMSHPDFLAYCEEKEKGGEG